MVGKNEVKSPQPNRGNEEKEDKKPKDLKSEERENMRGPHQAHGRGGGRGGHQAGHDNGPNERPAHMERGGYEGSHRGRGGHRGGGRGGGFGGPGGPRGDSGPRGMREKSERGTFHNDQPQVSLEDAMPPADKKFTGRCRLFVGNMPAETNEEDFKKMFEEHGEFTEVFLNSSRGFGFIRMDFRRNADAAKAAIDGTVIKGRTLRVRFATHGAALRVKYLTPHVSNEVLAQAFSIFGELERAVVIVDDRGKPAGEAIVEFARKPGAQSALKRISEGVFMLGASPRPITVEPLEQKDEEDGYPEKFVQKNNELQREREQPPRFAPHGSFEFDIGNKWKELYTMHEEQQRNLKRQFEEAMAKLEIEQAGAMMEHQTNMLRQDLLRRQEELRRLEELHQMELQKRMERVNRGFDGGNPFRRQEEERRMPPPEDDRRRQEMDMRRQQQEDRRQQELFVQQERAMREMRGEHGEHGNAPPMQPPPAPPVGMGLERGGNRQGGKGGMQGGHNNGGQGGQEAGFGGDQPQQLRQSRFDQPPGFTNQGQGHSGQQGHHGGPQGHRGSQHGDNENMGGGMGNNHGNMMGMGHGGRGGGGGGGGSGAMTPEQQERMMQERQIKERQMKERQMQERQQGRSAGPGPGPGAGTGGGGGGGGTPEAATDRNIREDFFEAKRARRF